LTSPNLSAETRNRIAAAEAADRHHRRLLWAWTLLGVVILPTMLGIGAMFRSHSILGTSTDPAQLASGIPIAWVSVGLQTVSTLGVWFFAAWWRVGTVPVILSVVWVFVGLFGAVSYFTGLG
jgi:hypothetical protein